MRNRLAVIAVATAAVVSLACNARKKAEECSVLIDRLNSAQQAAETSASGVKVTTKDLKKLAGILDQLKKDVGALSISTPELRDYANEYGKKAGEAAAAARTVATRVEAGKLDEAKAAKQKFDAIHASERELVDQINTFCGAP